MTSKPHQDGAANTGDSQPEWHCLRTQRKREHIAASVLQQIEGVDVFCPRISHFKKTRTGKKRFLEAMFPSYIFAKFNYEEQYRQVIHTQGVSHLVENGDARVIPETIITELKDSLPEGVIEVADPSIQPGAQIEILKGSLKGLNGSVIAQMPADERVEVLLEFLGREIRVAVKTDAIHLRDKE